MKWINDLNIITDFIEDNLTTKIDFNVLANKCNSSKFHFLRVFSIITGKNISEYIRERRLSMATKEVCASKKKIIDIAFHYQYETPESFCKAFKRFHGVSPTNARRSGTKLEITPPLNFEVTVKGDKRMQYELHEKDAFKVYGFSIKGISKKSHSKTVPNFLKELWNDGSMNKMLEDSNNSFFVGASSNYSESNESFDYTCGIIRDENLDNNIYDLLEIPASTWLCFKGTCSNLIDSQHQTKKVLEEGFIPLGYIMKNLPLLELFFKPDEKTNNQKFEIWIPVEN